MRSDLRDLIIMLKNYLGVKWFVETGTLHGETAEWASRYFDQVITIELNARYHRGSKYRYRDIKNINFVLGGSQRELANVLPDEMSIIWLDAHGIESGDLYKPHSNPIMTELEYIRNSSSRHLIFIDDEASFIRESDTSNETNSWPKYETLISAFPGDYIPLIYFGCVIGIHTSIHYLVNYCILHVMSLYRNKKIVF